MRKILSIVMAALLSVSMNAVTYTVAGSSAILFGSEWSPSNADNDMSLVSGTSYELVKQGVVLPAGEIAFKVCEDHAWTVSYPSQDYKFTIAESGNYNVTITFDSSSKAISANATKVGDAVVLPTVVMHGNFNGGNWGDTQVFAAAEDNLSASLAVTLAAGNYQFGMKINGSWIANGVAFTAENNSAVVTSGTGDLSLAATIAGEYIFTWTFATNTLSIAFPEGEEVDLPDYYLVGTMTNNWSPDAAIPFVGDSLIVNWEPGVYQFKLFLADKSWGNMLGIDDVDTDCSSDGIENGDNDNIKISLGAEATVKFLVTSEGKICITGIVGGEVPVTSYTVLGDPDLFGVNWDLNSEEYTMVENDGVWTCTIDSVNLLGNHDYKYKMVGDHSWDVAQYPQEGDYILRVEADGAYKVEFTLVPGEVGGSAVATLLGGVEPQPSRDGFYLVGSLTEWECLDAYKFVANDGAEGEYVLSTTLAVGDMLKVVGLNGADWTWYPDGQGNDYIVDEDHAGEVDVYFRPEGNADWSDFGGFIYIAAQIGSGVANTTTEVKAVKFIRNGQLFIRVNGTEHTVTGVVR